MIYTKYCVVLSNSSAWATTKKKWRAVSTLCYTQKEITSGIALCWTEFRCKALTLTGNKLKEVSRTKPFALHSKKIFNVLEIFFATISPAWTNKWEMLWVLWRSILSHVTLPDHSNEKVRGLKNTGKNNASNFNPPKWMCEGLKLKWMKVYAK